MSIERAKAYLAEKGYADRIIETEAGTPTVADAAAALHIITGQVAKTLSFVTDEGPILVVVEGDAKIQNRKYKDTFHVKAKMIPPADVEGLIGHAPGGVCPFGVDDGVRVFLDVSLKQHEYVYPAAGNDHSGVRLKPEELYAISGAQDWVDVCKVD